MGTGQRMRRHSALLFRRFQACQKTKMRLYQAMEWQASLKARIGSEERASQAVFAYVVQ